MGAMRKHLREQAKRRMKDEGVKKINKHDYSGTNNQRVVIPSFFAQKWKEWL